MESELETLVVRLMGDAGDYESMLRDAKATVIDTVNSVEAAANRLEQLGLETVTTAADTAAAATEGMTEAATETSVAVNEVSHTMEHLGTSLNNLGTVASGGVDIINQLGGSFQALKGVLVEVVALYSLLRTESAFLSAFSASEEATIRLTAAIRANGEEVENVLSHYKEFATRLTETMGISAKQTTGLLALAASYGLVGDSLTRAVEMSNAFAAINQGSAESYIRLTAQIQQGNLDAAMAMARIMPQLRGIRNETAFLKKVNELTNLGMETQQELLNTTAGRFRLLSVHMSQFNKQVGEGLSIALRPVAEVLLTISKILAAMPAPVYAVIAGAVTLTSAMVGLNAAIRVSQIAMLALSNAVSTTLTTSLIALQKVAIATRAALALLTPTAAIVAIGTAIVVVIKLTSEVKKLHKAQEDFDKSSRLAGDAVRQTFGRMLGDIFNLDNPIDQVQALTAHMENLEREVESSNTAIAAQQAYLDRRDRYETPFENDQLTEQLAANNTQLEIFRGGLNEARNALRRVSDEIEQKTTKAFGDLFREISQIGMTEQEIAFAELAPFMNSVDQAIYELLLSEKQWRTEQHALNTDVENLTNSLADQVSTLGMTSTEAAIFALELRGATDAQLAAARAAGAALDAWQEEQDAMRRATDIINEFRTPLDSYLMRIGELNDLLGQGLLDQGTFDRAMQNAADQFYGVGDAVRAVNNEIQRFDAALSGSAEAATRMEAFRELMRVPGQFGGALEVAQAGPVSADRADPGESAWRGRVLTVLEQGNQIMAGIRENTRTTGAGLH